MKSLYFWVPVLCGPLVVTGCSTAQEAVAPAVPIAPAVLATPVNTKPAAPSNPLNFEGEMGPGVTIAPVGAGWAKTSINAVVFRVNSIVTHGDTQFISYYNADGSMVLGKRKVGASQWQTRVTPYKGNVNDAHNSISLGVDGKGVIHVSWDMHGNTLRYARGIAPGSLDLGNEMPMTGDKESSVTYPQFYPLPNGDLLFAYREGSSGDGDMMLNRYDLQSGKWQIVAHPLIEGEGKRNAYINQMAIDSKGGIHLSWCWRETPNVATNHDVCYAFSPDQGKSWQKSSDEKYALPITQSTAEVAFAVPQNSDLINQTSMTTDANDRPVVVSYWRPQGSTVPQFQLVWHDGKKWHNSQVGTRTLPFSLSGAGTKRIPISRPQIMAGKKGEIYVIFRDAERGSEVTVAVSKDAQHAKWELVDLYKESVRGIVGVGTWGTQAEFKDIRVTSGNKTLFSSDFTKGLDGWKTSGGDWKVADGVLTQTGSGENARITVGDASWSNYTLSLKARKTGGKEGFLIIFGAPGDETKSWWNVGGWNNTQFGLEVPGVQPTQIPGKIETGRWYDVRVELQGAQFKCFLDGKLVQSGARVSAWEPSYDTALWKSKGRLNLFWQNVGQGDGESLENKAPQPVGVMEWKP